MNENTVKDIMSDPEFNPEGILENALLEYINNHPTEVAKDKVAMKYLVKDQSLSLKMTEVIDMNDVAMFRSLFNTIVSLDHYDRSRIWASVAKRMIDVSTEHVREISDIVAPYIKLASIDQSFMLEHGEYIRDKKIDATLEYAYSSIPWSNNANMEYDEWPALVETRKGQEAFIMSCLSKKMYWHEVTIRLMSKCSKAVKECDDQNWRSDMIRKIIEMCDRWEGLICFACGHGTGYATSEISKKGRYAHRPIYASSTPIRSLSGYTLHRKKCDPDNKFPSPYEIFFGHPKEIQYQCSKCKGMFDSKSGLTLHQKKCWNSPSY